MLKRKIEQQRQEQKTTKTKAFKKNATDEIGKSVLKVLTSATTLLEGLWDFVENDEK
jgi:hypothetical protein